MAISARAEAVAPRGREQPAGAGARDGASAIRIVIALTIVGAALRFATLDVQSLWLDESATIGLVERSFGGMLSHLSSSESAPPLYYVLVWLWTHVFGTGTAGFRSLSAVAGTLTIPVLYACGRESSERVGVWAAAFATFSPIMYYYSQEARVYAMLVLFGGIAFLCWLRALRIGDGRSLGWWALASAVALLTHYFAAFLFIPEAVILLRRMGLRRVWLPIGVVCAVGVALAPLAASQRSDGKTKWIEEASLLTRTAQTVKQYLVGLNGPAQLITAVLSGLIGIALLGLIVTRARRAERNVARDAAIVAVAGIALPLVLAAGHLIDVFDGRNVIAAWVPYAVVLATGAGVAGTGGAARLGAALGTATCAIGIGVIVATNLLPAYQRDDWRGIADALPAPTAPRVIVGEHYAGIPLAIYLKTSFTSVTSGTVVARELDFGALRERHSSSAPSPPHKQLTAPPGFRLAGVSSNEAYAVTRFVAPRPTRISARELLRLSGDENGEVLVAR
jgi:Dolichyl-phosphate-mannose-protein mannosyltransferase